MKVIIAGSRRNTSMRDVLDAVDSFPAKDKITEVVCGEAWGVDSFGKYWAIKNNIPVKSFPANWNLHGKSAGYKRNIQMAEYADALIAVSVNESKGTEHMINVAQKRGLILHVIRIQR